MAAMTDIQERLRSVQTRRSQAAAQRARDEVEVENAEKALAEAKANLETDFGVVTGPQLRDKRAELEENLEKALAAAEDALTKSGA